MPTYGHRHRQEHISDQDRYLHQLWIDSLKAIPEPDDASWATHDRLEAERKVWIAEQRKKDGR